MRVHGKKEPRIILLDLETMPIMAEVMRFLPRLSDYYGLTLKASINSIICAGWKVYGEKKTHCINAWDFPEWKKDVNNDRPLLNALIDVLLNADAVITHNGKRFDWRMIQTRLMINKMDPLPKIQHVDTCSVAKKHLSLFNNRLDTLGKALANDKKLENGGWDLWVKVMQRDKKAMELMERYCKQDVDLLEKVFKKLLPLVNDLPNYNIFSDKADKDVCPNCGSTRLYKNGIRVSKTAVNQRLTCSDCGTSSHKKTQDKRPKTL